VQCLSSRSPRVAPATQRLPRMLQEV
jgi:hypothetical protein